MRHNYFFSNKYLASIITGKPRTTQNTIANTADQYPTFQIKLANSSQLESPVVTANGSVSISNTSSSFTVLFLHSYLISG
jgi:hypothetical protein